MSRTIVITAATRRELSLMLGALGGRTVETAGGFSVRSAGTAEGEIILAVTGMGNMRAASSAVPERQ